MPQLSSEEGKEGKTKRKEKSEEVISTKSSCFNSLIPPTSF